MLYNPIVEFQPQRYKIFLIPAEGMGFSKIRTNVKIFLKMKGKLAGMK